MRLAPLFPRHLTPDGNNRVHTVGAARREARRYRCLALPAAAAALAIASVAAAAPTQPLSQASIVAVIERVFPDDQARAVCVADHESDGTPHHFSPAAQNGSNTGLFQIDERTWNPRLNPRALAIVGPIVWSRMHEALYNARVARRIYLYERSADHGHGNPWGPWTTRGLCGA